MAESKIEVRLVRCPKCENLLPEPKDCSFFKCGGCGTILCAKNKNREADSLSDNKSLENNRVKETEVNLNSCSSEESHSDDDPCSNLNVESKPGLDRLRKRNDSEDFIRFSASNYFQDSMSSDEAIKQDRAGLVRKLDTLKEQLLFQRKDQPITSFEKAPLRFLSSGKHTATTASSCYHRYQEPEPPCPYGGFHTHYSQQYIGNNGHDYARNGMFHQSSCSCSYDPYHRASGSVIPPSGLPDALRNAGFYHHHDRSIGFGALHSPRTFLPRGLQQTNAVSRVRLPKVISSSRVIRPVAGGAPFITCRNCSKLLKLPDSATRKQQKVRCGSCSCLIEFSFLDNKLVLSTNPASATKAETRSKLHWVTTAANFSSDDEFDSIDKGLAGVSADPVSTISEKAQELHIADSISPSASEDELSSDCSTVRRLTLRNCDRSGPRNQSSRSEEDRVITRSKKTSMRQNSMKEASVAIEIDESFNDSEVSQDSANDENRDDDQVRRIKKKSGFTSIVKNSFKELKKSIQSSDVSINGNPIPERLVKIAEKQAGPIRPGNYWYDYRAGFWGVMGNHCLGILPPFIEEFNYPMPENCANGNTSVFVNGRELHQKDLRLLAARGLPRDKDRSYTVYISGRVIDEDTGEELNNLGKLAPTVDKLKRGFGMRVPRRAA